jgi:hypothetical protein
VNKADANGNTAIASAFFWPEITALLLEKGADPNLGVYPALISACNVYSVDVAKMLLSAGADPNKPGISDPAVTFRTLIANEKAKGKDANQAAIKAWENAAGTMKPSEVELMRVLVKQTNCVPCLQMVLDKGAKIELKDGDNAIDVLASFSMSKEERKTAFKNGASAMEAFGYKVPDWYRDLPDDRNGTAIEMLDLLLAKNPDLNKPNNIPLVVALKSCNATPEGKASKLSVVKRLVDKGADIKIGTNGYSIMETSLEDVKCLVSSKNKTPIYWAVEKDNMELTQKIADLMVWKFNPDFSFNVISDVSSVNMGTYSVGCKKGKEKLFPSAYASELGNKEASKYLAGKGL